METLIYKVLVSIMLITAAPNCPDEDGLHCLNYSVKEVQAINTKDRKEAVNRLNMYKLLAEKDTLIKHVSYAQIFLSARLDSAEIQKVDSTKIK